MVASKFNYDDLLTTVVQLGKTPKKAVLSQISRGKANIELIERWNQCSGQPVQVIQDENNGSVAYQTCVMCSGRTSWYCVGCHAWFCMQKKRDGSSPVMYRIGKDGEKIYYYESCYGRKHMENWHGMCNKI